MVEKWKRFSIVKLLRVVRLVLHWWPRSVVEWKIRYDGDIDRTPPLVSRFSNIAEYPRGVIKNRIFVLVNLIDIVTVPPGNPSPPSYRRNILIVNSDGELYIATREQKKKNTYQ